jgi:hypothetical protein
MRSGGRSQTGGRMSLAIRRPVERYALTMGAKTAISAGEYLHTSFPGVDREYRDGELVERTKPDYLHGRTQLLLGAFWKFCEGSFRSTHVAKHA